MRQILPFSLIVALSCQAQAFKLPDQSLHRYQCKGCFDMSRSTLSMSWLIDDKSMVPAEVKPVKSKRYYRNVTGKDLKQGIELGVLSDGAVIRVTPLRPKQLDDKWQEKFVLKTNDGQKPLVDMVESLNDESEFKQQFSVGPAMIFQLKSGIVKQKPRLVFNEEQLDDNSKWQLSVYDRQSGLYISVALDKRTYQFGDAVSAVIDVNDDFSFPMVNWIEARVMGPNGQGMPVELSADSSYRYHGEVPIQTKDVAKGENWNLMVMADMTVNGSHTLRTAHAAFSYVVPSAKVRTIFRPSNDEPLKLKASVETIQASRYQLQAVLYATGDDGELHSVALAQTSAWLDQGATELPLNFDISLPSNMHQPYYLGQIELVDDAQLKPVYRYNDHIPFSKLDA